MNELYEIEVTEEDILRANRKIVDGLSRVRNCPVSLAIKRATGSENVSVPSPRFVGVDDGSYFFTDRYAAQSLIDWFDGVAWKKPLLPVKLTLVRRD